MSVHLKRSNIFKFETLTRFDQFKATSPENLKLAIRLLKDTQHSPNPFLSEIKELPKYRGIFNQKTIEKLKLGAPNAKMIVITYQNQVLIQQDKNTKLIKINIAHPYFQSK